MRLHYAIELPGEYTVYTTAAGFMVLALNEAGEADKHDEHMWYLSLQARECLGENIPWHEVDGYEVEEEDDD